MTPVAETVAYFARRMRVDTVVLVGRGLELARHLPSSIALRHIDDANDDELRFTPTATTLVAVTCFNPKTPGAVAARRLNAWAEHARAVLSFDPRVPLVDMRCGFRDDHDGPIYRPFGLDLGFGLFDPRLPLVAPRPTSRPILPIIACYNEVDIITACIDSLLRDGAHPIVLENWSTDGTFEALQPYAEAGRITLTSYPRSGPVANYEWRRLLAAKEELSAANPGAWIIHQDADEIRRGAFPELSLAQNLELVESYGSNAIDYTVLNFRPIDNGWARGKDPETHFRHFEFGESRDDYTRQIKGWLSNGRRPSLAEQAGHEVRFPERAVYPYKFMLKHYPLRSDEHGRRKLRKDRMPRFSAAERSLGWHTHYDSIAANETFLRQASDLLSFESTGAGGLGASFVTSLPPVAADTPASEPAPIITPRVWIPASAVLVIDLPSEPAAAYARELFLDEITQTVKACFETVTAISITPEGTAFAQRHALPCEVLDIAAYVENGAAPMARSIALSRRLAERGDAFVFGLAAGGSLAASVVLKSQGLSLGATRIIAVLGATTGQCLRDAGLDLHTPEHLELDHLEYLAISRADECLCAARSHADEWLARGVSERDIAVVPPRPPAGPTPALSPKRIDHVFFFGPLSGVDFEAMTGALRAIGDAVPGLPMTFVGPFGAAFGEHSGGFLVRCASGWRVTLNIVPFIGLTALEQRLRDSGALVVVARSGGAETIVAHRLAQAGVACVVAGDWPSQERPLGPFLCAPERRNGLSDLLLQCLRDGWCDRVGGDPAGLGDREISYWENWASGLLGRSMSAATDAVEECAEATSVEPLVTVGIPHFERAHHLLECVEAFQNQTYQNIEIIVVDDGSRREENIGALRALQVALERTGGRVVFQKNAYLGAARNNAFVHARGELVLFFDDDDVPHPEMVERMVRALQTRGADVVSTNVHFWETGAVPSNFDTLRCSSHFLGDAPSLAIYRNPFGSAAILVRRAAFEKLGGYTTDYGLGWEDYEFAARACLEGLVYENIPQPLYLYRVNYQGMAATTPTLANGRRVWRALEKYASHPRLAVTTRLAFMDRLWRDDKIAKYQWHHTLGSDTPAYHRLSRLPYNARESYLAVCDLAQREGQSDLAVRLKSTLIDGEWIAPARVPQPAPPPPPRPDTLRVLNNALLLHRMGAGQEAIALLMQTANVPHANRSPAYLGLSYLYGLQGRSDLAAAYAARVLQDTGDDPEALFALAVAATSLSDDDTVAAAEKAFEQALASRLRDAFPDLSEICAEEVLEHWANVLSPQGVKLVHFCAFPDDVERRILQKYRGWHSVAPEQVTFAVASPAFGRWLEAEAGVFLHPPDPGNVSVAHLVLPNSIDISAVSSLGSLGDDRAPATEAAIFVVPDNRVLQLAEVASSLALDGAAKPLVCAAPWSTLEPGGGPRPVQGQLAMPEKVRALVVATRVAHGASNNWHATTYLRRIRIQEARR